MVIRKVEAGEKLGYRSRGSNSSSNFLEIDINRVMKCEPTQLLESWDNTNGHVSPRTFAVRTELPIKAAKTSKRKHAPDTCQVTAGFHPQRKVKELCLSLVELFEESDVWIVCIQNGFFSICPNYTKILLSHTFYECNRKYCTIAVWSRMAHDDNK
jgi:hypothetical protein